LNECFDASLDQKMDNAISLSNIPSIDVFITNRCGLRCSHCFLGESLNLNLDMDFGLFQQLVRAAKQWNTEEFTFLGGEPTLYPQLADAIQLAQMEGYKTRIVTNGHASYLKFIENFKGNSLPFICFSMDGSNEQIHNSIRGRGSFGILLKSIKRSKELGCALGGIVAVSRQNAHNIQELIYLYDSLGFEYLNVHYVTNRGFAKPEIVLSIEEWKTIYNIIKDISGHIKTKIRVEKTFYGGGHTQLKCAVAEKSNLMFFPDGRVFMCMMFIDVPNSHSFMWTGNGLELNKAITSEQLIIRGETGAGCPAIRYVNSLIAEEAAGKKELVQCIYEKERL
jgi:MoaA/NifB/PqqE/SkfB family radical SAM enzyme